MTKTLHLGGPGAVASVAYTDANGQPAPVVGEPTWAAEPDGIVELNPAADGLSSTVKALAEGTATITVTAEGDETPGVDTITLSGDVQVLGAEATGGALSFA